MNNIVCLSGGADSTAMLLALLEHNESIHSIVFFDTGWEFPEVYNHIERVEADTGIKIVRLHPVKSFDYLLYKHPVVARKGPMKGEIHRQGHGWPSWTRRWCTREKINTVKCYLRNIKNPVQCIGFNMDEKHRRDSKSLKKARKKHRVRYPLIEYGITGHQARLYCKSKGYTWEGLYDIRDRVSCFCCPLQGIKNSRILRKERPVLWHRMLEMDAKIPINRGFNHYSTVHELEKRFAIEEREGG